MELIAAAAADRCAICLLTDYHNVTREIGGLFGVYTPESYSVYEEDAYNDMYRLVEALRYYILWILKYKVSCI